MTTLTFICDDLGCRHYQDGVQVIQVHNGDGVAEFAHKFAKAIWFTEAMIEILEKEGIQDDDNFPKLREAMRLENSRLAMSMVSAIRTRVKSTYRDPTHDCRVACMCAHSEWQMASND